MVRLDVSRFLSWRPLEVDVRKICELCLEHPESVCIGFRRYGLRVHDERRGIDYDRSGNGVSSVLHEVVLRLHGVLVLDLLGALVLDWTATWTVSTSLMHAACRQITYISPPVSCEALFPLAHR